MKTTELKNLKNLFRLSWVILIALSFSCSPETIEPQDDLSKKSGKSNTSILKTLVRGAKLNMANGIDIGPDGNLYIASVNGQEIVVMDKNNGKILDRIRDGVQCPDDLVFGPDGSLYWTDIITGEVGRRPPDGSDPIKQSFRPGVNPIAFNDDDRLFVALDFLGDGLYEFYPPDLTLDPRPIIECPTGFCLGFFNSFDFGTDGLLYGPLFALGQVIKVNVENGDYELVAEGFVNPAAAKFGPDGLLTVLDQTGEVWKVDTSSPPPGNKTLFTTLQPGLDNMVFDEDGSLYMTNNDEGWVAEILPSGQARMLSPGGMIVPQGLAVMAGPDNQDMVFQADLFSLRQFNGRSGQQENQYKGFLVPPPNVTSLTLSQNLSVSGDDLVISSFFSSTVQVFNPETGMVLEDYADQVAAPIDAVRLNSGEVIVSDLGLVGVIRMSDNSIIAPLNVASGLATDGENVWAADWATGNIFKIDFSSGTPVTSLVASGLSFPEGLALDLDGRLLVFETNPSNGEGQLIRIDLPSGSSTPEVLVEGLKTKKGSLPGFPPMWFFDGVDVGASGDIYLTGGAENVIHKIPKSKVK